ncbi:tight adherence protein D [Orbus hercynius]|uniref:Tight adherence protein D n=1 Tax=Orbus hercynius TaxID=593135 RepID=A0A495RJZ4_9GAMM|nr:tetratricopeptide repeat protein [Orbus hercynius]RKS87862.1 tight adherence protein D [Orbus hercynius]
MKIKYVMIMFIFCLISGCQNSSFKQNIDEEQKIYIHQTTKNYGGLIELYKNRLQKEDTQDTRYKLAQAYYLSNDFDSARRSLAPVIASTQNDNILVLYGHIQSKLGHYQEALDALETVLTMNPKNGEAYNLQGIVLIKLKKYDAARYAFTQARDLFYDENKVVNNLAMLSILNKEYDDAYNQLNILYNKGYRNTTLLHNLLYTLVKLNRIQLAKQFCEEYKLSNKPIILIEELKQIDPIDIVKFNEIVPKQEQNQKQYSFEKITENKGLKTLTSSGKSVIKPTVIPVSNSKVKNPNQTNELVIVRSGEHKGFGRISFESRKRLEQDDYVITQLSPTEFSIEIKNIALPSGGAEYISRRILNSNRDFAKAVITVNMDGTLIIKLKTKRDSSFKHFYAGVDSKRNTHILAIDFYSK